MAGIMAPGRIAATSGSKTTMPVPRCTSKKLASRRNSTLAVYGSLICGPQAIDSCCDVAQNLFTEVHLPGTHGTREAEGGDQDRWGTGAGTVVTWSFVNTPDSNSGEDGVTVQPIFDGQDGFPANARDLVREACKQLHYQYLSVLDDWGAPV